MAGKKKVKKKVEKKKVVKKKVVLKKKPKKRGPSEEEVSACIADRDKVVVSLKKSGKTRYQSALILQLRELGHSVVAIAVAIERRYMYIYQVCWRADHPVPKKEKVAKKKVVKKKVEKKKKKKKKIAAK